MLSGLLYSWLLMLLVLLSFHVPLVCWCLVLKGMGSLLLCPLG